MGKKSRKKTMTKQNDQQREREREIHDFLSTTPSLSHSRLDTKSFMIFRSIQLTNDSGNGNGKGEPERQGEGRGKRFSASLQINKHDTLPSLLLSLFLAEAALKKSALSFIHIHTHIHILIHNALTMALAPILPHLSVTVSLPFLIELKKSLASFF